MLSTKNDGAFFARKKGLRFVKDRIYFITPTGMFETGLIYRVLTAIKTNFADAKIEIDPAAMHAIRPRMENVEVFDSFKNPNYKLRDFQIETVRKVIDRGRGVVKIGTGGGKTLTSASIINSFFRSKNNFKCLMIVPDLSLVKQTHDDFQEYGVEFTHSKWTGTNPLDMSTNVVICNLGIIQSRYEDNQWINDVDILIIDEAHKVGRGNKVNKILNSLKTPFKIGLTGTLPTDKADEYNIIGKIGDIIYEKTSAELRKDNYLVNVKVDVLNIKYKETRIPSVTGNKYRDELMFLCKNEFRKNVIATACKRFDKNTLILVNRIEHGLELYEYIKSACLDKNVSFVRGDVDVEDRAKIISDIENSDDNICIAISAIFSTGINVKNLHMILFAEGGKSFIRTVQSIGRGLRLHPSKEKLIIIDIKDNFKYAIGHAEERCKIYDREKISYTESTIVEK